MSLILRSRALASLLARSPSTPSTAARPFVTMRGFAGLLDGASEHRLADPPLLLTGSRQRQADILDRLEL